MVKRWSIAINKAAAIEPPNIWSTWGALYWKGVEHKDGLVIQLLMKVYLAVNLNIYGVFPFKLHAKQAKRIFWWIRAGKISFYSFGTKKGSKVIYLFGFSLTPFDRFGFSHFHEWMIPVEGLVHNVLILNDVWEDSTQ